MIRIVNENTQLRQRLSLLVEKMSPTLYDKYLLKRRVALDFFNHEQKSKEAIDTMNRGTLFDLVLIETINKCNSACSFCEANKFMRTSNRPVMMEDSMFYSIIDQLAEIDYRGHIRPFGYGEPLMDPRMPTFVKYIKKKLPNAIKSIYTNGILLTPEIFEDITKNLDWIHINNYNDDLIMNPEIQKIYDIYKDKLIDCDVQIHLRKMTQMLTNRAGNTSNRSRLKKPLKAPCPFLYTQMAVRSDGKVSQCFLDVKGVTTVGDLTKQTLLDVWNGEELGRIKKDIVEKGRGANLLCEACDA